MADIRKSKVFADNQATSGDEVGQMFNELAQPVNGLMDEYNIRPDARIHPVRIDGYRRSLVASGETTFIRYRVTAASLLSSFQMTAGTVTTAKLQVLQVNGVTKLSLTPTVGGTPVESTGSIRLRRNDIITLVAANLSDYTDVSWTLEMERIHG